MPRQLSLHVVGVAHLNKKSGSDRRFEILICPPGEGVDLMHEPSNPADPQAVAAAVYSTRGA
jgi:hypothetical protein